MRGKRLVEFEKVPYTPEIQGRIGEQLKAQYDVAEPIPHRLAGLLEQLAQLELLKELTQLMDEPDSKGGVNLKVSRAGLSGLGSVRRTVHCLRMALQEAAAVAL